MSDTSLVFSTLYRDRGVSAGLAKTSAAVRASQVAATVGTIALGAAMGGAAAHAIALGASALQAGNAIALMPAAIAGAVATGIAAKSVFGGLAEAWKATGVAAVGGGGAAVDVAHRVELAHRAVRDATTALSDAQRDAKSAQEALTRARESAADRIEDLSRTLRRAQLDERGATLAVAEARTRLSAARRAGDVSEIKRAQLAYDESRLTLEEVQDRLKDVGKEQQRASQAGVEGSDEVQSALERQKQAQAQILHATEQLADAQRALAQAGKSLGGGVDKAAQALAALAPSARETVLTARALAPAWSAAGKAAQQAAFAGVAGDLRSLSGIYLPSATRWLRQMGSAFNLAMRDTASLAKSSAFARDFDSSLSAIAQTTRILASSIRPVVNGVMQFVAVGVQFFPGLAGDVGSLAQRFERWAVAARESGRMNEWISTALGVLKQLGQVALNVVGSVAAVFHAGQDKSTLDGLVNGTAAMRKWLESAEGQKKVSTILETLRNIFSSMSEVLPVLMGHAEDFDTTLGLVGKVAEIAAGNLDTLAKWLPAIAAGFVIAKTAQVGANIAMVIGIPLRIAEMVANTRSAAALRSHTIALTANTAMGRANTVGTVAGTVATTAGDVAQKRSLVSMIAARAAMIAGAAATGVVTAAQWLWNIAVSANPIGLIILAVIAFIAIIVLLVKHHKVIGEWIGKAWDWIWDKIKSFGRWIADVFVPALLYWLTWPYRKAWEGIKYVWDLITGAASRVNQWVIDKMTALVKFFISLPSRMKTAVSTLWDGLKDSFKAAVNWLIKKWNDFSLTIGGGTVLGVDIPSVTLNTPNIPLLDVGGDVRRSGLAVIHQGERVVPAAQVDRLPTGGGGRVDVVELRAGDPFWDMVLEGLRKMVRDRGGDVQFVIGKGN